MFEKLVAIRERVKAEMGKIPKWDIAQNMLRMHYWSLRMSSLKGGVEAKTKEAVLAECIQSVKKEFKDFTPRYDEKFFKI